MPIPLAISGAGKAAGAVAKVLPIHISFASNANPGRIRTAQDDLVKALNGDLQAIDEINVQRKGSATSVGKKAFQASWDQLIAAGKVPADGVLSTAPIATMPKMLPAMSGLGELNTAQIVIIGIGLVVGLFVLPRIAKGR